MIGTTLDGKYHITKLLGAGAMGSVYEAEHASTGRRVAIKVISAGDLTKDQLTVNRFQREARAAGTIDTQHITQVLDAGMDRDSNLPFLVMEYLTGEDLQHLLKRLGPLAPDLALRIVAQACLGLQKAHEAHVVHRDIKPANLFLARRDAGEIIIKLLDFGIAKVKMDQAQDTENAGLTQTGSMLGSPLYMSPEQARGQNKEIDHRADIWSLGVVLYQALAGRTPYQHITALGELIIAIVSEWPPHVQEFAPWAPPEVAAIVHRALRHNPEERFQSAAEMFTAIRQVLPYGWSINEEMLVPLHEAARMQVAPKFALTAALAAAQTVLPANTPANAPVNTHVGAATAGPMTTTGTSAGTPASASKAPMALGAGALMLAAGVGIYMFTRSASSAPPPPVVPPPVQTIATATSLPSAAPSPAPTPVPIVVAPVDTSLRRVKVVILPADASIEVESKRVFAKNGLLEIEGMLGSVHRVRLFKGKYEVLTEVIVTESGPSPPKLELTYGVPKATVDAGAGGAPPPPPVKPGVNTDDGEFK